MPNEPASGGTSATKTSVFKGIAQEVPRILPMIVLADISWSMTPEGNTRKENNIGTLNKSIRDMIELCKSPPNAKGPISMAVITFGNGEALVQMPLTPATDAVWQDVAAAGNTPLGAALSVAAKLLGDKTYLSNRDYRPVLVLASDGEPNDDWETSLDALNKSGRAAEADRFAVAIGTDANRRVLQRFIEASGNYSAARTGIFEAGNEAELRAAFQYISFLSRQRSVNQDPNKKVEIAERTNPDVKGLVF
jgi:uncharacterized protein YegL